MRKLLFTIIIASGWMLFGAAAVSAAVVSRTYDRTYAMAGDHVHVSETSTVNITAPLTRLPVGNEAFVVFNPILTDPDADAKIQKTLPTIKAFDRNGNIIAFTTQTDGQDILIYITRPTEVMYNSPQTFRVEYDSYSLSSQNGALYDLYIPSFAKDFKFENETTLSTFTSKVVIPKRLGDLNLVIPSKHAEDEGDNWELNFSQQDLTGTLSWIQIGTTQYYSFEIRQPYPASTNIPIFFNTFSVLLPRDVAAGPVTQSILFTEISPTPNSVYTDANGNLVANFVVPANSTGTITIKGFATTKHNLQVDFKNSGSIADVPAEIIQMNTAPAQYWEVNAPEIQAAAKQLKGESSDIYELVTKTYQFVVDKINYDEVKRFGLNERQGALATLLKGSGVCMEYSDLFIALMRAEGVPARGAFGYGYDSRSTNGEDAAHQWAEVYIPKLNGWIAVDTTWGESGAAVIGGDLNHFYKYVASVDPNTPSPVEVAFFGSLGEVKDESFAINSLEKMHDAAGITEADLIAMYPAKSPVAAKLESLNRSLNLAITTVDAKFSAFLASQGSDPLTAAMIKSSAYTLVVLAIGLFSFTELRKVLQPKH